jgi:hypothetical protein
MPSLSLHKTRTNPRPDCSGKMSDHSDPKSSGPHRNRWLSGIKSRFSKQEGQNSQNATSSTNGRKDGLITITTENFNTAGCLGDKFNATIDSPERAASTIQAGTSKADREPVIVSAAHATSTTNAHPNAPTIEPSELCPISELWNEAYKDLKVKEKDLMKNYESNIPKVVGMVLGATADVLMPVKGMKTTRRDQIERILRTKVTEAKDKAWKLRFNGMDIAFKDFAEPLLAVIGAMDNYVTSALSANPYASIAWAGVSLILPVSDNFLNLIPACLIDIDISAVSQSLETSNFYG